jgi:hypothetical protein
LSAVTIFTPQSGRLTALQKIENGWIDVCELRGVEGFKRHVKEAAHSVAQDLT